MPMSEEDLFKLFLMLRRPIPWDPVPSWIKLTKDQVTKFNELQTQFNVKLADLEAKKASELAKVVGVKLK